MSHFLETDGPNFFGSYYICGTLADCLNVPLMRESGGEGERERERESE